MAAQVPLDLTLELAPRARFDIVDLQAQLPPEHRAALAPYPSCLYWSAHTTAGFLEIDNNAAERALRAVAIGRKNYLPSGTRRYAPVGRLAPFTDGDSFAQTRLLGRRG